MVNLNLKVTSIHFLATFTPWQLHMWSAWILEKEHRISKALQGFFWRKTNNINVPCFMDSRTGCLHYPKKHNHARTIDWYIVCWVITKFLARVSAKQKWKRSKQQFFVTLDHYCWHRQKYSTTPTNGKKYSIKFCPKDNCTLAQNFRAIS